VDKCCPQSSLELWPNVGHNFEVAIFLHGIISSGPMARFPRVRPPYRVVSMTLRHIPPMPYFCTRSTISFAGCLAPFAQTEFFGLSTTPIYSWTHLVPRSAIPTSGLIVVNGKSASRPNEKSTSIQAESFQFLREPRAILQAKAQPLWISSFGLRLNPCGLASQGFASGSAKRDAKATRNVVTCQISGCRDIFIESVISLPAGSTSYAPMWSTSLSVSYARLPSIALEGHIGRFSKSHCEPVGTAIDLEPAEWQELLAKPLT
jgi:hypothetical protein